MHFKTHKVWKYYFLQVRNIFQNINQKKKMYYFLDNPIGRDGAEIIAHYLKQNNSLEKLNLSFCDIDDQGAIAIVNSLQNNSTLKELSFGGKLFIYSFIHLFMISISILWNISVYFYIGNQLTDKSIPAISKLLEENSIRQLDLHGISFLLVFEMKKKKKKKN